MVGLSFGAIASGAGLPWWLPVTLSVLVFAGASQFVFVGILSAGGGLAGALLAALLVNARHLPFGFSVAPVLGAGWRRALGTHLMVDETVAFALAQPDPRSKRAAYWLLGSTLFATWNAGVVAGVVLASAVTDSGALGLDAAFPAMLLALVAPALRDRRTCGAGALGAAVALAVTPMLPAGIPVLLALVALLVVPVRREGGTPRAAAGAR
ncbi:branched-chain amino acid ABC transporter permease [Haloechinothrix sp. LS1_15]|nr:branched-chain amino acid ABC transporter permease [Haloechinothrix sp. LS1_15]